MRLLVVVCGEVRHLVSGWNVWCYYCWWNLVVSCVLFCLLCCSFTLFASFDVLLAVVVAFALLVFADCALGL